LPGPIPPAHRSASDVSHHHPPHVAPPIARRLRCLAPPHPPCPASSLPAWASSHRLGHIGREKEIQRKRTKERKYRLREEIRKGEGEGKKKKKGKWKEKKEGNIKRKIGNKRKYIMYFLKL
jgi:hypothetical protein